VITTAILTAIATAVSFFDSLLPSVTMPSWLAGGTILPSGVASTIGGMMAAINGFVPIDAVLTALISFMVLLPVVFAYVVFNWIYKHVPTIAGFSLGSGG
jgi:hypothetical protein